MFKFWHVLVVVLIASLCIYASNHVPVYSNIVS
jgi:hypothetical protein